MSHFLVQTGPLSTVVAIVEPGHQAANIWHWRPTVRWYFEN